MNKFIGLLDANLPWLVVFGLIIEVDIIALCAIIIVIVGSAHLLKLPPN